MMKTTIVIPARVLLGFLAGLVILAGPIAASAQSCSASPTYVKAGTSVRASWGGFYSSVTLRRNGVYLGTSGSSGSQYFSTSGLSTGTYSYSAYGQDYNGYYTTRYSNYFYVSNPDVSVTPAQVHVGGQVQVTWSGFSGSVIIYRYNDGYQSQVGVGSSSGTLSVSTSGWSVDGDWQIKVVLQASISVYEYSPEFSVCNPWVSNPGLVYQLQPAFTVSWSGYFGPVDVDIYRGNTFWKTELTGETNSLAQIDPSDWEPRSDYQIMVRLEAAPTISDISGYFTVEGPAVAATPDVVLAGDDVDVTWSGFYGTVNVDLYDGSVYHSRLRSNASSLGDYILDTSGLSTGFDWRIRVTLISTGEYLDSNDFAVHVTTVSATPDAVVAGNTVNIVWTEFPVTVNVDLYDGPVYHSRLRSNTSGSGSHSLNTGNLSVSSDWQVKVAMTIPPYGFRNSNTFTIRDPSVSSIVGPVIEGEPFTVDWSGYLDPVDVEIWRGGAYWYTELTNTTDTSTAIDPSGWEQRSDYQVRVVLVADPLVFDVSNTFTVYVPTVSTTPDSVTVGETVLAEWSGFPQSVNVEIYKGGTYWRREMTQALPTYSRNLNTTGWEVRSDYRVRVHDYYDSSIYRYSGYFSVTAPDPPQLSNMYLVDTSTGSPEYVKNGDGIEVRVDVAGLGTYQPGDVTADLSGFGSAALAIPSYYGGSYCRWNLTGVTCTPSDGPLIVEVTATNDYAGSASLADTITADNTVPDPLTGLTVVPGHETIDLSWADASGQDANFSSVRIQYVTWNAYPGYDTPAPDYPPTPYSSGSVYAGSGTNVSHNQAGVSRRIYRYAAFVLDHAGNYGPAVHATATNYILGDVGTGDLGPYDGLVTVADHTGLASTYGLNDLDPLFRAECDVGPTDDFSPTGVPEPDGLVGFEDLVVFAMNYESGAKREAPGGTGVPVLAWERVEDRVWALRLVEPCANLKALRVTAELPAGVAPEVSAGDLLTTQTAPVFLRNIDRLGLDAGLAILGRGQGIVGSGELLRVRLSDGSSLDSARILVRGIGNEEFELELQVPPDIPEPVVFSLAQNIPNPFNPMTKIVFALPEAQRVNLSVYTLRGRRVVTLIDESRSAGNHEVIWDGRDDSGRTLSSGSYLYRIVAGPYTETRKMILMK